MGTEECWENTFGDEYHKRQGEVGDVRANTALFSKILNITDGVDSVLEFGAGTGRNLEAISRSYPEIKTIGVEINEGAAKLIPADKVLRMNILDYDEDQHGTADLVFTKGVAIHVSPEQINRLYGALYNTAKKYILMAEYYSPTRVEIEYQGEMGRLWKANFYEEMVERYPALELVDYGFVGPWDEYPQDSINWWLWKKS